MYHAYLFMYHVLKSFLTILPIQLRLACSHKLCIMFFKSCIIGGTPDKRIYEGSILIFLVLIFLMVFIGIIGGTPDKRFYEGLF